jgi:SAM-dependent methyltransferase
MDRVVAIHVLEHLPDLPACLQDIRRILRPSGKFLVVIPCEGGLAYALARHFTSKRIFEQRYQTDYEWLIRSEHVNQAWEIIEELEYCFHIEDKCYYPFHLPFIHLNAIVAMTLTPRQETINSR